jgi:hypothetical protein
MGEDSVSVSSTARNKNHVDMDLLLASREQMRPRPPQCLLEYSCARIWSEQVPVCGALGVSVSDNCVSVSLTALLKKKFGSGCTSPMEPRPLHIRTRDGSWKNRVMGQGLSRREDSGFRLSELERRKGKSVATARDLGVLGVGDGWSRSIGSTHEKQRSLRHRAGTVFGA